MTSKPLHMTCKNIIFAQKLNRSSDFKLCTSLQETCEGTLMCNELKNIFQDLEIYMRNIFCNIFFCIKFSIKLVEEMTTLKFWHLSVIFVEKPKKSP